MLRPEMRHGPVSGRVAEVAEKTQEVYLRLILVAASQVVALAQRVSIELSVALVTADLAWQELVDPLSFENVVL
jgi:hypothetical protein